MDKFTAVWLSHSSISDFIKCPRAYYLKNVYKDLFSKHKVMVVSPSLSLGSAVHNVLEIVANTSIHQRPTLDLHDLLEKQWKRYSGEIGGFHSQIEEDEFKIRGHNMLEIVHKNIEPLMTECISMGDDLPYYWVSEPDNIILCGKVDWLSKNDAGSLQIIDFKTGKNEENDDSLQLPIYALLVQKILKKDKLNVSYWYIDSQEFPTSMALPDLDSAEKKIIELGLKIKLAKQQNNFLCPRGENGCYSCRDLEKIVKGTAKYLGVGDYNKDLYSVN